MRNMPTPIKVCVVLFVSFALMRSLGFLGTLVVGVVIVALLALLRGTSRLETTSAKDEKSERDAPRFDRDAETHPAGRTDRRAQRDIKTRAQQVEQMDSDEFNRLLERELGGPDDGVGV